MRKPMLMVLGLAAMPVAATAQTDPYIIGSASQPGGGNFLDITVTAACHRHDLVQVVAVQVGANGGKITAVDSRGLNLYQAGGGRWKGADNRGYFLATTSPSEPTNFGLGVGDTITLTYSKKNVWKAAIAECVPGVEIKSGSADNKAGGSIVTGNGTRIKLEPSSRLLSRAEPLFVATILDQDAFDTWMESPRYTTLLTLQNGNTLNLAYQRIDEKTPTDYSATNSAPRAWSASNRSYKTTPPH